MAETLRAQLTVLLELAQGKGDPADPQVQSFFNAFCRAFLSWQFVEANLSRICSHFVIAKSRSAMMASYHSVLNLNIRLGMIDSAARSLLKGEYLLEEWLDLHREVSKRAVNRNNLAHFTVSTVSTKDGTGYRLCPTIFDPLASAQQFDTLQLEKFRDDFMELADALGKYEDKLEIRLPLIAT
ncbi:MAG TPA: hypothetical protein VEG37_07615 [Burkholderiales bacterium]|nr:hypothetical protein [Burkholderiales bacterium]